MSALAVVLDVQSPLATEEKYSVFDSHHPPVSSSTRAQELGISPETEKNYKEWREGVCSAADELFELRNFENNQELLAKESKERRAELCKRAAKTIEVFQQRYGDSRSALKNLADAVGVNVASLYRWKRIGDGKPARKVDTADVLRANTVAKFLQLSKRKDLELIKVTATFRCKAVTP